MRKTIKIILLMLAIFSLASTEAKTVKSRDLNRQQQAIIRIAALTGNGDLITLKSALNTGLATGLTINQIKEVIVHVYAYAGFPRSIRGLQTFMSVLEERKANGIQDNAGLGPSPITDKRPKYDRGKSNLDSLLGSPQNGTPTGYGAFAPIIDTFLKEHLFADIFERDVLTYPQRELATISVLASIGSVEPMLQSHMKICLNVGLSPDQLEQFIGLIQSTIGSKEANAAKKILAIVLQNKN